MLVPRLSPERARTLTAQVKRDASALWAQLLNLYEGGAHLALGYPSWAAYCAQEFEMSDASAYRLLQAARVVGQLPMGSPLPQNERQARELARIPDPEVRRAVWEELTAEEEDRVTAAKIHEAAQRRQAATEILRGLPPIEVPRERKIFMQLSAHYHYVEVDSEAVAAQCVLLGRGGPDLATDARMLEAYAAWVAQIAAAIRRQIAQPLRLVEGE